VSNLRIYFATDVHGSERCFRKFVNAGKFYKADAIILGGDITGKMIVPVIEQQDGTYAAECLGTKHSASKEEELQQIENLLRSAGYYPYRTNPEEMEELSADPSKVDQLFLRLLVETVTRWVAIAEENLRNTDIQCFITPGNDDRLEVDKAIEGSDYVVNPEGRLVTLGKKFEMISSGWSNITPWKAPRECTEQDLGQKIESMASKVTNMDYCIFNLHCPPYDSQIDYAPRLDETLKPITKGGGIEMTPCGSIAVRKAIEKYQPMVCLHGHIHESAGSVKLGRTLCLNPGSEYTQGVLKGAIVNFDDRGIKSYLLVSG
jgi:Icc-related predicted phosphoesterase